MNIEVYLQNKLDGVLDVPVFTEHQENDPDVFVLIDKTGSRKKDHLISTTLAFQSYALSKYEASELNEKVKEKVEGLIQNPEISAVRLNSDYDFTDTETKRHRYQAVFDIYHY